MRSRRKKRPKKSKRGIYILPNLFTAASLFSGFYAIISAIQGSYENAAVAILISCVFDALDGKVARFTGSTSHFGTEFDSLSDLVAFGVAPGILAYQWGLEPFGWFGFLACFMYVICGALRLARFNVQKATSDIRYFKGLPIPGAASVLASLVLFIEVLGGLEGTRPVMVIVLTYVLSFLMVSTVRYISFKKVEPKRARPFNVFVGIILFLIVVAYKPKIMLFLILALYALSGPCLTLYYYVRKKEIAPHPLQNSPPVQAPNDIPGDG